MIKAFIELEQPLIYVSRNTNNKEYLRVFPSIAEWATLKQLERIFEVFITPTIRLQSEYYININKAFLYIYQIYNKLKNLIEEFEQQAIEELELVSYMLSSIYLLYILINPLLSLGRIL